MGSLGDSGRTVRIGVDVGGTNTDAVAIDLALQRDKDRGVVAHCKTPTTPDATSGIESAVRSVLEASGLIKTPERIASVTIGTTHFINAVIERDARRLRRVAVVRLSKSFLREVPPFAEFPPDLTAILRGHTGIIDGGLHIDGSQEAPVREEQVVAECAKIRESGETAVVVAGVYSPIDEVFKQESTVRDIIKRELPGVDVVCSHEASASIGFIERENAAILNGAILQYARKTVGRFRRAMKKLNLHCPLFLTQNDGTILDAATASKMPIRTFSSGPTNSMRGAAYLSGLDDGGDSSAIVVDIGGTTSDLGVLLPSGMPRQASAYVTVAGVRVNYSMPHLHSIGLGGGSIVRDLDGKVRVGPDSVGNELLSKGLVFGGGVCTTTDIAVASGKADVGAAAKVSHLDRGFVEEAGKRIKALLEGAIDVIKTSPDPIPVLLVGGGAILSPETLEGASQLVRPPFHDVANAVGAAIARVCGAVDIVQGTTHQTEHQAIEHAKEVAIQRALEAGALKDSIRIAEIESMPLQYVANQVRTMVKAVGDVDLHAKVADVKADDGEDEDETETEVAKNMDAREEQEEEVDPRTYKPEIQINDKGTPEWIISPTDLDYLANGCYVLGCAGGGSPAASRIQLRGMLRDGHRIRVIDQSSLKDDDVIYWGGHMGSPAVSVERLQSLETVDAFKVLMEYLNHTSFDAVMGLEIGGANGLEPFLAGASRFFDAPVIDGDWMGRAYPTYWQTTLAVHAPLELVPCAIDSGDGKSIIMTRAPNDEIVDRALRASCSEMGSRVGMAAKPTTTDKVRNFGVLNTVSLAWRIGRAIALSKATNTLNTVAESIIREAGGQEAAKVLFRGKITRIDRRLFKGHSYGTVYISAFGEADEDEERSSSERAVPVAQGGELRIPFKNENIYAEHVAEDGTSTMIATVPDLIAILDNESGQALGVPEFKYGYRVTVIGITCSPRWTETKAGIDIGGPGAFGYEKLEYKPLVVKYNQRLGNAYIINIFPFHACELRILSLNFSPPPPPPPPPPPSCGLPRGIIWVQSLTIVTYSHPFFSIFQSYINDMHYLRCLTGASMVAGAFAISANNLKHDDPPAADVVVVETVLHEVPGQTVTMIHMPDPTNTAEPVLGAAAAAGVPHRRPQVNEHWIVRTKPANGAAPTPRPSYEDFIKEQKHAQDEAKKHAQDEAKKHAQDEAKKQSHDGDAKTHGSCLFNDEKGIKFGVQIDAGPEQIGPKGVKISNDVNGWNCKVKTWDAVHYSHGGKTAFLLEAQNGIPYILPCNPNHVLDSVSRVVGKPVDFGCKHVTHEELRNWFVQRNVDARLDGTEKKNEEKKQNEAEA
ncbi:uncharacterized protein E0L32_006622 [Thyridium curvatum]|uniref:Hydantoinase/oxoprolinase n=1 Tax=Thyridium curvatum TaxID=1093900 RepID=A0A507AZT4_9PEZI|nr:uncharacterized protein E0L32_006622 [Thyridium curvatum]TPX12977.1 hypothetical protein E0L32_006622 [Thyridium curvatum]